MTILQIREKANSLERLGGGMTVNERLYLCGVIKLFDEAMKNDRKFARSILTELKVDEDSIQKIVMD